MGDQYLSALAVKAVVALQKDDLELCIALARRVEVQLGQNAAFLEVAVLITAALAQVVRGQGDQARRLLGLAQQRNHFLEGRYLDMQLANVEVILALEQGQVKQAQLLIERLRQRARPLFEKSRSALALPTITEALTAYYRIELDGLEERLGWALGHVDVINPIDFYAQGQICLARTQRLLGRPKEALASLAAMQALASRNQSWRFFAQAMAEEINLILQDSGPDRLKRAEQRLKSVDWNKMAAHYRNMAFNPVNWSLGVSRVRLLQGRGHFSEALHEITQLRGTLQPGWHGLQRLRLDILAALSYQRLGYQERANSLLGECLINAEREGVRSLFIEEGDGIRQLLQQLESTERQPALQTFIRGLLGIWPGQGVRKPQDALEEGLDGARARSGRLAAQGLSNEEIGQRLSLALGIPSNGICTTSTKSSRCAIAPRRSGEPRAEPALTMGHRDGVPASTIPLLQTKLFPARRRRAAAAAPPGADRPPVRGPRATRDGAQRAGRLRQKHHPLPVAPAPAGAGARRWHGCPATRPTANRSV